MTYLLLLILFGCEINNATHELDLASTGMWTFIETSSGKCIYGEIYFDDTFAKLRTDSNEYMGQTPFTERNDSVQIGHLTYHCEQVDKGFIKLISKNHTFSLYRIPFNVQKLSRKQIDPYYMRRSYFLVNLGIMTSDEAIAFLNSIEILSYDSIEEVIIGQ